MDIDTMLRILNTTGTYLQCAFLLIIWQALKTRNELIREQNRFLKP